MPGHRLLPLPPTLAGRWALLALTLRRSSHVPVVPRLVLLEASGTGRAGETFPTRLLWSNVYCAACFISKRVDRVMLQTLGDDDAALDATLHTLPVHRGVIALIVLLRHPAKFLATLWGGSTGLVWRTRMLLANLASRLNRAPGYNR